MPPELASPRPFVTRKALVRTNEVPQEHKVAVRHPATLRPDATTPATSNGATFGWFGRSTQSSSISTSSIGISTEFGSKLVRWKWLAALRAWVLLSSFFCVLSRLQPVTALNHMNDEKRPGETWPKPMWPNETATRGALRKAPRLEVRTEETRTAGGGTQEDSQMCLMCCSFLIVPAPTTHKIESNARNSKNGGSVISS